MTLTETLLVLTLLAILYAFAAPGARRGFDSLAVRTARETVFGMATRARVTALERGGADLVIDLTGKHASVIDRAGRLVARAWLADCDIEVAGADSLVVVTYDSRGLGRMASRTVEFRRRAALAGLSFSSYGRVRRW
ncbi:MAG: hypothetical protein ACT443_00175 [Gemmatimonadota bacterium]